VAKVEGAEIFVVAEGPEQEMALGLVGQLRRGGLSADYDPGAGKWGKQLEMAVPKTPKPLNLENNLNNKIK
jgi:hypothetical protein